MNSICVVVQGRTESNFVKSLKDKFKNIPLIFSTWVDADKSVYSETDIVLYNEYPANRGPHNFHLQRISSLNGFIKAKELGYKRVIKWRCDLEPNNSEELLKLFDIQFGMLLKDLRKVCINLELIWDYHSILKSYFQFGKVV